MALFEILFGQGEVLEGHQGHVAGVERVDPLVRVVRGAPVEDGKCGRGISGLLDGDQGADFVGVLVARVELVDDGEDVVEVVEAVVDRRCAVILDGPEVDRVGGQSPVAERRVLQEFSGRDIDDGRPGDLFPSDPVGLRP